MKITYVTAYFLPYKSAGTERALGYVNVAKANKNISLNIICPLFKNEHYEESSVSNIRFLYTKINFNRESSNFLKRLFVETLVSVKLLYKVKKNTSENEKIIITSPFLPIMFLAPIFLTNRNLVLEIRDSTWDYFNNRYLRNFLSFITNRVLRKYHKIVTVTKKQFSMIPESCKNKSLIFENGISLERFKYISDSIKPREENSIQNLYYCGTLGQGQNLLKVAEFLMGQPNIFLRIRGRGPQFRAIEDLIKKRSIENIELLPYAPFEDVLLDYQWSDCLLLSLEKRFYSAIPSKIYEYLATGRKVIALCSENSAIRDLEYENLFFLNHPDSLGQDDMQILNDEVFPKGNINIKIDKNLLIRERIIKTLLDNIA